MKKIITLCVGCLLLFIGPITVGQSKYFEKSYGLQTVQHANQMVKTDNGTYLMTGPLINYEGSEPGLSGVIITEIDNYGNQTLLIEYPIAEHFTLATDIIKANDKYIITGGTWRMDQEWLKPIVLQMSEDYSFIDLDILGDTSTQKAMYAVTSTPDKGYVLAGFEHPTDTSPSQPYVMKVDTLGNVVWQQTYADYSHINWFSDILPAPNGGYLVLGTINNMAFSGDVLLMKIDENGEREWERIYPFTIEEYGREVQKTLDNGLIMVIQVIILGGTDHGLLVKLDNDYNIEWQKEDYFTHCGSTSVLQLSDSSFVFTGCERRNELPYDNQLEIVKLDKNGNYLWHRYYGGEGSDYGYHILETDDGGLIVCGRNQSGENLAEVYVVKTNCMGLLTEPQATFDYTTTELTTQFTNTSQYVYPDSTDGGYYHWNFGDGNTSNEANPSHTYGQPGVYTVTLTGIVCTDASVFTQEINVGAVGIQKPTSTFSISPFYPNPATQTATMSYDLGSEQAVLQVFDVTGRLLKSVDLKGKGSFEMDLANWVTGVYFYQVTSTSVAHSGRHNSRTILREKLLILD